MGRAQPQPQPGGGGEEGGGRLVEAEVEPRLARPRPRVEEVQPQRGLPRPRRARHQRGGPGGDAPAEHRVQARDAEGDEALRAVPGGRGDRLGVARLGARVQDEPGVGDGVGVLAAQVAAAAELAHLGGAQHLHVERLVAQHQHAVHHRVRQVGAAHHGADEQQRGAADGLHERLHVEQEAAQERLLPGALGDGDQAVEDEQGGVALPQGVVQHLEERREAALLQGAGTAEVDQGVAHHPLVVEGERAEVAEHAAVGLGQQGDVDRPPARRDVGEGELVAEDRLAGAGVALDQIQAAAQQAAAQDDVEPGDPGRDAVEGRSPHGRGLAHVVPLSTR